MANVTVYFATNRAARGAADQSPEASHQYYRRSPKVRTDIAAVMGKDPAVTGGPITL